MLLYGPARDPATCKPTKDSEIAVAAPYTPLSLSPSNPLPNPLFGTLPLLASFFPSVSDTDREIVAVTYVP